MSSHFISTATSVANPIPTEPAQLSFSAYGVRVRLLTSGHLAASLPGPLLPTARPEVVQVEATLTLYEDALPDGAPGYVIGGPDGRRCFAPDFPGALACLESCAEQAVAESATQFAFVHAGVVGWKGRAILLPGPSLSGKSTLTAALVAAGATYYSDEYAVLNCDGRVHPFRRPLRLRHDMAGSRTVLSEHIANQETGDLPVGLILRCFYEKDTLWTPKPLTPGGVFFTLLENTVNIRSQSKLAMQALRSAALTGLGYGSKRAEAEMVAASILDLCNELF